MKKPSVFKDTWLFNLWLDAQKKTLQAQSYFIAIALMTYFYLDLIYRVGTCFSGRCGNAVEAVIRVVWTEENNVFRSTTK